MSHRKFRIKPSRVNDSYVRGTLYHYDKISDDDARAIGATHLPGLRAGAVSRHDGVTARRLQCGRLNVVAESTSSIFRDQGVARFMDALLDPAERGSAETAPAKLLNPAAERWAPEGVVEVDIVTREIRPQPEAAHALSMICPGFCRERGLEDHLKNVHIADRVKVRAALSRLVEWYQPSQIEYRYGSGAVRARTEIVRNAHGLPAMAYVFISVLEWGVRKRSAQSFVDMPGGDFEFDLDSWLFVLSPEATELRRAIRGSSEPYHCFFASLRGIHIDDVGRCFHAVTQAAERGVAWDFVYRIGDAPVHTSARVLQADAKGKPLRLIGHASPAPLGTILVREFSDSLT